MLQLDGVVVRIGNARKDAVATVKIESQPGAGLVVNHRLGNSTACPEQASGIQRDRRGGLGLDGQDPFGGQRDEAADLRGAVDHPKLGLGRSGGGPADEKEKSEASHHGVTGHRGPSVESGGPVERSDAAAFETNRRTRRGVAP